MVVLAGYGRPNVPHGAWSVAVWAVFCTASNVLPVPATRNVYLSMSSPVNVAIATLFPPGTAALLVAASSVSEWEIRRQTTVLHAAYNRAQLGLSTAAAAGVIHAAGRITPASAVGAVVAYQLANWSLVAAAESTSRGTRPVGVLRGLLPRQPVAAVSYFVLGLMGTALAVTYLRVGTWAVLLLMLPLLGARHAVAASGDLERSERAQRALASRLIDERERERTRIAADIHDVVLQQLAALQLAGNNVRSALRSGRVELADRLAGGLEAQAGDTITSLRGSIASLRRTTLDDAGLGPTLARYVRAFVAQSGIETTLDMDGGDDLPLPLSLLLYECAQEALTNLAAHAAARHAHVALGRVGDAAELRVTDDGVGMPSRPPAGSGLRLLREKVELSGGRFTAAARRGGGTEILVRVPLGAAP